ncbi:serine-rich adhesin for platelets-like [Dermacentor albipictus]|uniref:serine-rich adhesin for platelets-like n=1 Tax=Dermacentor albipictus TaxID=60249 RepID=UPI0031FC0AC1
MRPRTFENLDVKDLRVTPASKRLRRIVIGASVVYIFIFTPVMGYFIWNYMMAAPNLSRPRHGGSADQDKTCANRRLPSLHFGLHRAGRHRDGAANGSTPLPHANDTHSDLTSSGRQMDSVVNFLRERNLKVNRMARGGGSHPPSNAVGRQQAAGVEAEQPSGPQTPQAALILDKDNRIHDSRPASTGVPAGGAAGSLMQQKQQPWEPGKQPEAGGQAKPEIAGRGDHPSAAVGINNLPVQIGRQEMAVGEGGPEESSVNDEIRGGPASITGGKGGGGVVGSGTNQDGGRGRQTSDVAGAMASASSQNDASLGHSEKKLQSLGSQESAQRGEEERPTLQKTPVMREKVRERTYVGYKESVENDASGGAHPRVYSNRQGKDKVGVLHEGATLIDRKPLRYSSDAKASVQDRRGYKGGRALSSAIGSRTAEELRRLRSEKLMLKLRKLRNMARQSKDPSAKRGAVLGDVLGKDGHESARQVDVALQKELVQMTERKGRRSGAPVRASGSGFGANREQNGSAASSADNSDKQRMIDGIPSNNKEANEVLSFAEFFKKHLSPKQRPSKVHDGIDALQGRRLMIDYTTNKKGKDAVDEGIDAGGWPEKPEKPPPTKYTLDPYHPYIARRGAGWDFYDPLKPATERNNAKELAEQEFYSPDRPSAELRRRLAGRFLAAPPSTSVPFFGLNESSLQGFSGDSRQDNGSAISRNESAAGVLANVRPAIRHALSGQKTKAEYIGRGYPENKLSPNLNHRYDGTEGPVPAVFQYPVEQAVGGTTNGSEKYLADVNSGLAKAESNSSMVAKRRAPNRSEADSVGGDAKAFPLGSLSRDERPRSRALPSDIGAAGHITAHSSEKGADQRHDYRKGPDSSDTPPNLVNRTGNRGKLSTKSEAPTSSNAMKDDRGRQKPGKREETQNEANTGAHDEGLPSSGSRGSETDKKSENTVVSLKFAGSRVPERDSAPIQNGGSELTQDNAKGSASAVIPAVPKLNASEGVSKNNSKVRPGLINIEPIPIEGPEFIAVGDANDTTTATPGPDDGSTALGEHGKEYEDMVPEDERTIFQSALNHSRNATHRNEDTIAVNSSARLPTPGHNGKHNFKPEVMELTPPKMGSASPTERELTRSHGTLSSSASPERGALSTHLTTNETDNDLDDVHNHDENYLRIDARAVKKVDAFTEPSNVDIVIQNKVAASGKSGTTAVVLKEVPKVGTPKISAGHVPPAGRDASRHLSQTIAYSERGAAVTEARPSPVPTSTSTLHREKSGFVSSSPKAFPELSTPSDKVRRRIGDTFTSPADRDNKTLKPSHAVENAARDEGKKETKTQFLHTDAPGKWQPSEAFGHKNVSAAGPGHRSTLATRQTRHTVSLGKINGITIEVIKGTGHHPRRFGSHRRRKDVRSSTGSGRHPTMTTSKNASHAPSTAGVSKPVVNKRALAEESSTPVHPSDSTKIVVKESTQKAGPTKKLIPEAKDKSATSEEFTQPPIHLADKRGHFERMTPSSRGTLSKERTSEEKSSANTGASRLSVTGSSPSPITGQHIRASDIKPDNRALRENKLTTMQNRSALTGSVTQKMSSTTPPTVTKGGATTHPRRERDIARVPTEDKRVFVGGGKTPTPSVRHSGKETSANVAYTRTVSATTSASTEKRIGQTKEVEGYSKHSGGKRPPETERSTTRKLDRPRKETTHNDSKNVPSDSSVHDKTNKPVTLGVATKSSTQRVSPSQHLRVEKTSQKTTHAGGENKTRASTFKSTSLPPVTTSTTGRTVSETSTSETPIPEVGAGEDMLGMLEKQDKIVMSTFGPKDHILPNKQASTSSLESPRPDGSAGTVTKPHIVAVSQTTRTEQRTHADQKMRTVQTTVEEQTSSKDVSPEELRSTQPKLLLPESTTATNESLVFDTGNDDDDDEEEDEARLHFPMMKITRRPSTTPRRPAIMDLFGRRHHVKSKSTTTLRPVLQHNIVARRGHRARGQETKHRRLQHDIAVRRRRHHQSPPPKPYQMTLFHGEPLHAVRIAVKRRG